MNDSKVNIYNAKLIHHSQHTSYNKTETLRHQMLQIRNTQCDAQKARHQLLPMTNYGHSSTAL